MILAKLLHCPAYYTATIRELSTTDLCKLPDNPLIEARVISISEIPHHYVKRNTFNERRMQTRTRKVPGALDPAVFPFLSGCKIHYGHSRYEAKWCKFMKLVIYRTFDVFAATPPPPHVFSAPFL